MKRLEDISSIKNLDYSSKDCQILIREFSELIGKMAQEYDALVIENQNLMRRLEQLNQNKCEQVTVRPSSTNYVKKSIYSIRLYGFKATIKKIANRLRKVY